MNSKINSSAQIDSSIMFYHIYKTFMDINFIGNNHAESKARLKEIGLRHLDMFVCTNAHRFQYVCG